VATSNTVAFYISGHGFGHASRQVEIINALGSRHPGLSVFVRSSATRWLLERTLKVPIELDARHADTGVVQLDSLRLDARATMATAARFYAGFEARVEDETRLLRERGVSFVVSDAPPLGCAAAHAAGVPSVVVSNFTWDWIYEAYLNEHSHHAREVIDTIQSAYARATAAWRLPMHGDFMPFRQVIDIPFVARHASRTPEQTRRHLGLPLDARLALPSFGGYGVKSLDLDAVRLPAGWEIVRGLDQAEIYDAGLCYQDLVHAVDLVVTKPGYGIVSECIANGTPLVYTSRGVFPEYDVFVREMPRYLRCAYISNDDLLAGRWGEAIEAAVNAPAPPEQPRTDGAEVVADMMAACLPGASSSPPPASP
jgi:hypothetical protein